MTHRTTSSHDPGAPVSLCIQFMTAVGDLGQRKWPWNSSRALAFSQDIVQDLLPHHRNVDISTISSRQIAIIYSRNQALLLHFFHLCQRDYIPVLQMKKNWRLQGRNKLVTLTVLVSSGVRMEIQAWFCTHQTQGFSAILVSKHSQDAGDTGKQSHCTGLAVPLHRSLASLLILK